MSKIACVLNTLQSYELFFYIIHFCWFFNFYMYIINIHLLFIVKLVIILTIFLNLSLFIVKF